MQTCYNCGREVDDNVLICPECGALVKRYGRPETAPQPAPAPAEAVPHRAKRFTGFTKFWLVVCIAFSAIQFMTYCNLFYLYANQETLAALFAASPELAQMQTLMNYLLQSVDMFLWFYILAAALFLGKTAGLIWFAASGRRRVFLGTAVLAGVLCILTLVTSGLLEAFLVSADVLILYLRLRRQWPSLPR